MKGIIKKLLCFAGAIICAWLFWVEGHPVEAIVIVIVLFAICILIPGNDRELPPCDCVGSGGCF